MSTYRPGRLGLLRRRPRTDKSDYGHTLVLGGSRGMGGAILLAAESAMRSGAGLVTTAVPSGLDAPLTARLPESLRLCLPQSAAGSLAASSAEPVLEYLRRRRVSAVAIGPGLGVSKGTAALCRRLLPRLVVPTVLDADGLNVYAGAPRELLKRSAPLCITPHRRECERLFGEPVPAADAGRVALAKRLARLYHLVLVLKGHHSVVTDGERVYINPTGNAGMAKGGTGDVLTGLIAGLAAQGLGLFEAAVWGVRLHGRSGDLAVRQKGLLGITAGDLIRNFPGAFKAG